MSGSDGGGKGCGDSGDCDGGNYGESWGGDER